MSFIDNTKKSLIGANAPTLRAVPPLKPAAPTGTGNFGGTLLGVHTAIRLNKVAAVGLPVAPTSSADPNVGQAGSDGNAGNIAGAGAGASYAPDVSYLGLTGIPAPLAQILRFGLPVAGVYFFAEGHRLIGGALVAAALPLWVPNLLGRG